MENIGQMTLAVDLGGGRHVDVECGGSDQLWVAVGPGFIATDVWLKECQHLIDMRVRVRRTERGVEIAVDRGDGPQRWWNSEAAPRLSVSVDQSGGTATAVAGIGNGEDFQEVLLGRNAI